jgi:hypothetical protein
LVGTGKADLFQEGGGSRIFKSWFMIDESGDREAGLQGDPWVCLGWVVMCFLELKEINKTNNKLHKASCVSSPNSDLWHGQHYWPASTKQSCNYQWICPSLCSERSEQER